MKTILTIDYASINPPPPYADLRDRYGIRLYFRKFSMGGGPDVNLEVDVPKMRDAGGILGGTHWVDPTQNWINQAGFFLRMIDKWKPLVLLYDIEQWWAIWGKQDPLKDPKIDPQRIVDCSAWMVDYVRARAPLPYLIYTARWFTISYAPKLGAWIDNQPAMIASYPDYFFLWPPAPAKPAKMPYRIQDYTLLTPRPKDILDYCARMDPAWMAIPTGVKNVKIWQITSRALMPEANNNPYDVSRWMGTEEEFNAFLGLDSEPASPKKVWGNLNAAEKDDIARQLAERAGLVEVVI